MKKIKAVFKVISFILVFAFLLQTGTVGYAAFANRKVSTEPIHKSASKGKLITDESGTLNIEESFEDEENEDGEKLTAYIVGEETDYRSEFTKHFRFRDGTYAAVLYANPVHFTGSDGSWKEINNNLELNKEKLDTNGKPSYTPVASGFDIRFPQNLSDGSRIIIGKGDRIVEMGLSHENNRFNSGFEKTVIINGELNSNSNEKYDFDSMSSDEIKEYNRQKTEFSTGDSDIKYENVLPDTDIVYSLTPSKIKESIIVKDKSESYEYCFDFLADNLIPIKQDDGSINIYKNEKDKKPYLSIQAPYMFDASGEESYNIDMELNSGKLTIKADCKWINAQNRDFPVIIDPTITYSTTSISDTYVSSLFPNTNYDGSSRLNVGKSLTAKTRSYLKLSLPSLPEGSVINKAELKLVQSGILYGDTSKWIYAFDLYKNNSYDMSVIKWNNQPVSLDDNGPADNGVKQIDYQYYNNSSGSTYFFDITKSVRNWYEGCSNRGILLTSNNETSNCSAEFHSADSSSTSSRPSVVIYYNNNVGLEDYWSYESLEDFDPYETPYVNVNNGSMTYIKSDVEMSGNLLPISISHIYNSNGYDIYTNTYSDMIIGKRFHLNIQQLLLPISSTDPLYSSAYRYRYYDEDGTLHYYYLNNGNIIEEFDPTLKITTNNGVKILSDSYGNKKYFNSNGLLFKIEDRNGNIQTITLSGSKITQVTDPVGRTASFSYDNSGKLISITDNAGRITSYDYTADGSSILLSDVISPGNIELEFTYSNSSDGNRLSKIDNMDYLPFEISYNSNPISRVSSLMKRSVSIYFNYSKNDSTGFSSGNTIASDGVHSTTYLFDRYGHALTRTNEKNQTEFVNYANNNFNTVHKKSDKSIPLTITNNYIKNHGFEDNNYWTSLNCVNGSYVYSDEESSSGNRSLKMALSSNNSIIEIDQEIVPPSLLLNEGCTLSLDMYFKSRERLIGDNCGVRFGVAFYSSYYNGWSYYKSEWITGTAGWERFSLPDILFDPQESERHVFIEFANANPGDVVYIDNVQIERGNGPGSYNLMENSNFVYETDAPEIGSNSADGLPALYWTGVNLQSKDGVKADGTYNCFVINGVPNQTKSMYQTRTIKKEAGQTLILGGKAAAYASNSDDSNPDDDENFGITIELFDAGNIKRQTIKLNFSKSIDREIQTKATAVKLGFDCYSIKYTFKYSNQIGRAYFYGAFIYADNYGDIYSYNDNGILTKASNGYDYTEDYVISNNIVSGITRTIGGETKTIAENTYDANHNITEIENDEGADITYSYGSNGQVLSKTYTTGLGSTSTETYTYIQNGNYVKTHTDADGITTTYTYDSSDQAVKGLLMSVTKSSGESLSFTYDPNTDELISVNVPGGGNQNTDVEITYTDGKISNICHNSTDYSFTYQTNSDVINKAYIGSQLLFTNSVYKNRIESRYYESLGLTNYFPRNLDGNPRGENWGPSDSKCGFVYDKSDRVCLINDVQYYPYERNRFFIDYALYDKPSHVIGSDKTQSLYEYDMAGNVSHFTFLKDNDTIYEGRYRLNEKALPESVFVSGALTVNMQYLYDDFYRVTSNSCGPIINSYSYPQGSDVNNADIKPIQYSVSNYVGSPYHQYTLQYDTRQNITSVTEGSSTSSFTYNSLDQLQSEVIGNDTYSYAYDAGGNITSVSKNGVVQKTFTYGNSQWKDQITKIGNQNVTYNSIGNITGYGNKSYGWTRAHLLSSFSVSNNSSFYIYNIGGKRIKKTVGGIDTDYIYSGDLLMRQITGSDIIDFSYDYYGKPIGFNYNGNKYFYIYDCLGNVVNVVDPTGTIQATYSYDAWGNILSSSGAVADINPIRYKGYYYDTESGLYFIKTRYYNPELRRFISPDTEFIAGDNLFLGLNMYSYCYSNPLKYIDNDGKEPRIRTAMINFGCEAIRISSKLISKTIKSETDSFFNFANNEILPDIDRFFGQVFVKTEFMESTVKPMIEKGTESVMTRLVSFFPGMTETFDRPTGLRHFIPIDMRGGAVWAKRFLGFEHQENSNNYTSPENSKFMWQSLVGYSTVYDFFFSLGGPIFRRYYEFQNTDNGHTTYYVVWIWKGDYWNLGAGAEIGIYTTNNSYAQMRHFYNVNTNLRLVVDMNIKYYGNTLNHINMENWWVCSFSPDKQFPKVSSIDVNLKVKFCSDYIYLINSFSIGYQDSFLNNGNEPWTEVSIPSTNSNYQFDINY